MNNKTKLILFLFLSLMLNEGLLAQTCQATIGCPNYEDKRGFKNNVPITVNLEGSEPSAALGIFDDVTGIGNSLAASLGSNNTYASGSPSLPNVDAPSLTVVFANNASQSYCPGLNACTVKHLDVTGTYADSATIYVNLFSVCSFGPCWDPSRSSFTQGLKKTLGHEMLHGLGQGDTRDMSSLMYYQIQGVNNENGPTSPTPCDIATLKLRNAIKNGTAVCPAPK